MSTAEVTWTPDCITARSAPEYVTGRLPIQPYQAYRLLDQVRPFRHGMRYWYRPADLDALIRRVQPAGHPAPHDPKERPRR